MVDFLSGLFVDPFFAVARRPDKLVQILIQGVSAGVMYSLIALGFVLIFKASGVFNFAQGIMVVFAGLSVVVLIEAGVPAILAIAGAVVVMIVMAFAIERLVLRPLVNQDGIILFMATIGLAFFLEGFGQIIFGADPKPVPVDALMIPDGKIKVLGGLLGKPVRIYELDLTAAGFGALMVAAIIVFLNRTKIGRALRAVADDNQAALSVGIPLRTIWVLVWSLAGIVAIFAGVMWGAQSQAGFSLAVLALKALPVLILGGFTSVPGAIIGGTIIGVGEKLGEFYWRGVMGDGVEQWLGYVIALIVLLVRPQGLFGEKIIERI
ncbi:MAG: branched-chain amino acid ABC transporter permease [Alphaproteobacteria bacterium]|nr:MAG: branched-chain amino acid ABC transporter permease [Alphaproteobacteria bacterium]